MTNIAASDLVLVDTNLWIDFLAFSGFPEQSEVQRLMRMELAATTGIVSAEVLYGARSMPQFDRLEALLGRVHFLETTQAAWKITADLAFALKRSGEGLPLADLIVAAVALEYGCPLYTRDQDFERIPGLRLYKPDAAL